MPTQRKCGNVSGYSSDTFTMQQRQLQIILIILVAFIYSCTTSITLLEKSTTKYGIIKFYIDNKTQSDFKNKRLLASVNNEIFYSFYSDKIIKQSKQDKNLINTLFYGLLPTSFDTTAFQKLSAMDSSILLHGDRILDSLGLTNYKKSKGATAFDIEVNYYHGYPDNKKFRP
jgi:hypothetical protein